MACANCAKNKAKARLQAPGLLESPPFGAVDIRIYDATDDMVRSLDPVMDWRKDRDKLLLFFPETFTPVCGSEMGALNDWVDEFAKLGMDVYGATTDPVEAVKDWYNGEEALRRSAYKVISSYILPTRLGVVNLNRAKRASVFIMRSGEVVVQEHFANVGRSLAELHRQAYAYSQDSYCGEGWKDPSDGFLKDDDGPEG